MARGLQQGPPGASSAAPGGLASLLRVRNAALRCHELRMNEDVAREVLLDCARGDEECRTLLALDAQLGFADAEAAAARVRADLDLLARDESDSAELEVSADVAARTPGAQRYVHLLTELYRQHNPDKVDGLPELMRKYEGKEPELYRKVCEKYEVRNEDYPVAVFHTSAGTFEVEIYLNRVPVTASNFIDLARGGFYDGIHFHRVVPGVISQFGCPHARDPQCSKAGTGGPPDGTFRNLKTGAVERRCGGGNIRDEHCSRDSNRTGTLSMANGGAPDSGGSQFFINMRHNPTLDWFTDGRSKHPVFGKVVKGLDVCRRINCAAAVNERPVDPVRVHSVSVHNMPP
ncbi:unnamed protein product [Prorocentrum cordatum]|uniref:peptidylprolyl isomerase n=1 Tax=Prorocentrum cordatum TaxID=2364126 RepID=A0ABN9SHV6_9DINO|nr:unnamed protein product [Polarella glacialis]